MKQRGASVTGFVVFAILVVVTFYFSAGKNIKTSSSADNNATTTAQSAQARFVPYGWREYRSTAYRFSLLYPAQLAVKEYIEGGNALTITFQDLKKSEGFQIFITPYAEAQISDERFKKDVPSGVRVGLTDTTIDGATGAAFYSENATLGETKEVWFIHDGFLFEVTTPKPLEGRLNEILRTWQFI